MTWRLPAWLGGQRRKGAHRPGAAADLHGPTIDVQRELKAAEGRLARLEAQAPAIEQRADRAAGWLKQNHLGPLFDQAFGAGK